MRPTEWSERRYNAMATKLTAPLAALAGLLLLPGLAAAQGASIAGVVKDSTGAILPGVTVEARSPALIEASRSVVTDETGQYRIVDLRPGVYTGHVHVIRVWI